MTLGLHSVGVRVVESEVRRILPEEWGHHWPQVSEALDRIAPFWSDYWTKDWIREAVMSGIWYAWGFGKTPGELNIIVLTQIIDFPANRILQVLLAFGNNLDKLLPTMEAALEKFAALSNCRYVEIVGRPGWERKLPRFRRHAVLMRTSVPKWKEN